MELKGATVLITAGGTREYIDDVRVVTNISTGALGAKIADEFLRYGSKVHYVHGKGSVLPHALEMAETSRINTWQIVTSKDLMDTMKTVCSAFKPDIVIHSAAVSDFTFDRSKPIKISSSSKEAFIEHMRQTITKTPKIISGIKNWCPTTFLVGFKFTVGKTLQEMNDISTEMAEKVGCDIVIANDKEEMTTERTHVAHLFSFFRRVDVVHTFRGKDNIARGLVNFFMDYVP